MHASRWLSMVDPSNNEPLKLAADVLVAQLGNQQAG
jgi:hypothetical protein